MSTQCETTAKEAMLNNSETITSSLLTKAIGRRQTGSKYNN